MPTFEYIVRTQDGKRLEGKIDASNINGALFSTYFVAQKSMYGE